ncbi:hypothetical protein INT44_008395 [Umbelopsis vinacea]|uniref:Uncharacterized protein n=1 Tax=Umbelopsis vinacea TaxID=44442 RepID=A0A8H7UFY0_9FUNG|nr:hypothetical protein INT44_008395 [Umbelopsis vinacea]
MPYQGRKRQKTIAHGGKQVRVEETQSQHPDSEEDTSSSSVENPEIEDHSSTENEEEDDRAASSEAPEQHSSLPLVTRMDDQAGLSSTAKQRPLKRFDITPLFSAEFSKFQQQRESELLKTLKTRRQLTKRHRQLSRDALKKRALLEEQKNLLKQLEVDITSLTTGLKDVRNERTRKRQGVRLLPTSKSHT